MSDYVSKKEDYEAAYEMHRESPKALHWINYQSAAIRYRKLVEDLELEGKSVLDAGCGMGYGLPFLLAKSTSISYLGVDIVPEFIDFARQYYQGYDFKVADCFSEEFDHKADVVISSGVMNANVPNWLEERQKMVTKLYSLADEVLAFNMAGDLNPAPPRGKIAYANAQEIAEFCKTLSPDVKLKTGYYPQDFTIIMRRN